MNAALSMYVLLFAVVYDAVAIEEFDHELMKALIDELIELDVFEASEGLSNKLILCKEYHYSKCYNDFTTKYSKTYEPLIVKMIFNSLTKYMDNYNRTVQSFMYHVLENLEDNAEIDRSVIEAITFKESKVNCVAEFLEMFKKSFSVEELVADYIHYYYFDTVEGVTVREIFVTHINTRLYKRKYNLINPTENFIKELAVGKRYINKFSEPFCKLEKYYNFKWRTAKTWMWSSLQTSTILPDLRFYGRNIFDHEGIIAEKVSLGSTMKEFQKAIDLSAPTAFYENVMTEIDLFLLKVIFRQVVYLTVNIIKLYYSAVGKPDDSEKKNIKDFQIYHDKLHYFRKNIKVFEASLEIFNCYLVPRSINIHQLNHMYITLRLILESLKKQLDYGFNSEGVEIACASIMIHLYFNIIQLFGFENNMYIHHHDKSDADISEMFDDYLYQMEEINFAVVHIAELKLLY